jgi:starvation-inducible DNA-binding protein
VTTKTRTSSRNAAVAGRLQVNVATAIDLYSQLKQAHWAVVGPTFIALHELFDQQATAMSRHVDGLAERLRQLDGVPAGTVRQAARLSELDELPDGLLPEQEAVSALCARYESFAARIKEDAKGAEEAEDLATQDLYIEIMRDLDMQRWFLRSHLQ